MELTDLQTKFIGIDDLVKKALRSSRNLDQAGKTKGPGNTIPLSRRKPNPGQDDGFATLGKSGNEADYKTQVKPKPGTVLGDDPIQAEFHSEQKFGKITKNSTQNTSGHHQLPSARQLQVKPLASAGLIPRPDSRFGAQRRSNSKFEPQTVKRFTRAVTMTQQKEEVKKPEEKKQDILGDKMDLDNSQSSAGSAGEGKCDGDLEFEDLLEDLLEQRESPVAGGLPEERLGQSPPGVP